MKSTFAVSLAIAAAFHFSGKAEAREAVISSYELTSALSENTPGASSVHIEGFAEAIAEGCEATRAQAKLVVTEIDGKVLLSADVSPRLVARRVPCAALPTGFQGLPFSADFELSAEQLAKAELSNVKSFGAQLLLNEALNPEPSDADSSQATGCESIAYYDVMCTMEYNPTTCRYGELSLSAGNLCVARGKIQKKICESEGLFAPEELTCSSGETR